MAALAFPAALRPPSYIDLAISSSMFPWRCNIQPINTWGWSTLFWQHLPCHWSGLQLAQRFSISMIALRCLPLAYAKALFFPTPNQPHLPPTILPALQKTHILAAHLYNAFRHTQCKVEDTEMHSKDGKKTRGHHTDSRSILYTAHQTEQPKHECCLYVCFTSHTYSIILFQIHPHKSVHKNRHIQTWAHTKTSSVGLQQWGHGVLNLHLGALETSSNFSLRLLFLFLHLLLSCPSVIRFYFSLCNHVTSLSNITNSLPSILLSFFFCLLSLITKAIAFTDSLHLFILPASVWILKLQYLFFALYFPLKGEGNVTHNVEFRISKIFRMLIF